MDSTQNVDDYADDSGGYGGPPQSLLARTTWLAGCPHHLTLVACSWDEDARTVKAVHPPLQRLVDAVLSSYPEAYGTGSAAVQSATREKPLFVRLHGSPLTYVLSVAPMALSDATAAASDADEAAAVDEAVAGDDGAAALALYLNAGGPGIDELALTVDTAMLTCIIRYDVAARKSPMWRVRIDGENDDERVAAFPHPPTLYSSGMAQRVRGQWRPISEADAHALGVRW